MRHTGIIIALLSTAAIVGTTAAGAWPVVTKSPAPTSPIILAQMGDGMGGMGGGGMGGGGMGGGGMGGGGMGGGGMGGGGMGGGGMGGSAQRPGGMGGGGMRGDGGGMRGDGGGMRGDGGGMRGDGGGMRGDGGMRGMGGNNNRNRNRNVNVNRNVYVRGVRPWSRRAWYGTAIGGITLGTIIAVSAVPPVPADNLCWFWVDSFENRGYWDWCVPPM